MALFIQIINSSTLITYNKKAETIFRLIYPEFILPLFILTGPLLYPLFPLLDRMFCLLTAPFVVLSYPMALS